MRGEILSCGHESLLPKQLIPRHQTETYCETCQGYRDRVQLTEGEPGKSPSPSADSKADA